VAVDVIVRVVPGGLMAVNQAECDKLERMIGREVSARISQPRNLAFHRKFFALLHAGLQMSGAEFNDEQFRAVCITGAGHCDFVEVNGKLVAIPRSISFAAMDELEFDQLYRDVHSFICENWAVDEKTMDMVVSFM
jgi:hypothetical protein